ncbi:nucleotidyltransferase domain-containing protein [Brevibacillus sp. HB1.4B]|uniref:nucleotidyltransferase domain-containing protein n=1 Tax=Brevibacillus sp. HB1.4B TaxID=2738845 RepID=UPI00156A9948|nr:nucleotidyltransferase domain-containing protein [Brevibacillus sp. HB1.4B]NRS18848.1 nucleotidyltransferase domain-containing protein [Brevibacillus sp. HB1.4B]
MEQSKDVTEFFVSLAREFLDEWPLASLVCAYAGGSVGRGEADAYSDLDLHIFVEGEGDPSFENRLFRGHVIQLQVQAAPTDEEVYENPWAWRYLKEAKVVLDPEDCFTSWMNDMCAYMDSLAGKEKMFAQAKAVVDSFHEEAQAALMEGFPYSAYLAAWAGWIGAHQMSAFFQGHSLSDAQLYQLVQKTGRSDGMEGFFQETYQRNEEVQDALMLLADYRAHLRSKYEGTQFALAVENDWLVKKKAQRLQERNQFDMAGFLLFSEAIWLYHSVDSDEWLENHWADLPAKLSLSLQKLGFFQADEQLLSDLRYASAEIIAEIG